MSTAPATQKLEWNGPALLSIGFRPFFLGGSLWAVCAMVMWVLMLADHLALPTRFDPVTWHAHAFLFGYLGAIFAGFLLTALPNWTGRKPVSGGELGTLVAFWLAGRLAIAISLMLPWGVTAAIDLGFPILLAGVILREIVASQSWKHLLVLGLLASFTIANAVFHLDAAQGNIAAQGPGLRLGLGTAVMMIAVIGGRIVPAFTRNWLVKQGQTARPVPPMQTFDKITLLFTAITLLLWLAWPLASFTGLALISTGILHLFRLARWRGWATATEPLLLVLHAGYAFVPIGALAMGAVVFWPNVVTFGTAQHLWMAGAIGLMSLAVMTRATLGHTGSKLHAGTGTVAIYVMIILSVIARLASGIWPDLLLVETAAVLWVGAFGGFAILYGARLLWAKSDNA